MVHSGSYNKDDVVFLLKLIDIKEEDIKIKESLIQNNTKHYSEMIGKEYVPTKEYMEVFNKTLEMNARKVAKQVITLSHQINNKFKRPILVSLVRAGTPVGVLMQRTLKTFFNLNSIHYSISIIRDRGIDENALKYIIDAEYEKTGIPKHILSSSIVFIDGWTGKGVINRELKESIDDFNIKNGTLISPELYVLADISGVAENSASNEDYFIPSAALNSTISGLISRSILNKDYIFEGDFHGCKFYEEFKPFDMSLKYIDTIFEQIAKIAKYPKDFNALNFNANSQKKNKELQMISRNYLEQTMVELNIDNINYIKPGVCETTRVLLRRVPHIIFVKNLEDKNIEHIIQLSKDKNVQIIENSSLPYRSVGIIKELD